MFESIKDKNQISELHPAGFALFSDPESFTTELSANEQAEISGGTTYYHKDSKGNITNIINVVVVGAAGAGYGGDS